MRMSNVIPKERLTAYERWEMASFGDNRPSVTASVTMVKRTKEEEEEEVAALREEARQKGYAIGLEEGRVAGLSRGQADVAREALCLKQIVQAFGQEVAQVNEVIAEDMLNLALDLAKAMLKTTLEIRPKVVIPIVSEAVRYLPSVQQPALLFLNPQDAILIREHMQDDLEKAGWRVVEDAQIGRGGCRIETASNQIDATAANRWQRIAEALGKESDWLEE